jgi:hypothetical protein
LTSDRLQRALRGELDTIVLTAAAQDPALRYSSVTILRRRYPGATLRREPIKVRPPNFGTRSGRWVRRASGRRHGCPLL